MLKTVYKANIDIVHIQREETSTLFSVSERGPMNSDDGVPGAAQDTQNDGLFQVCITPSKIFSIPMILEAAALYMSPAISMTSALSGTVSQ